MSSTRIVHWDIAQRLMSRALAAGAQRIGFCRAEWRCSGDCESPYLRTTVGRPRRRDDERFVTVGRGTRSTLYVDIWLRCNHCSKCLTARGRLWRGRATHELLWSSRTWMGTLTFKPSERYRLLAQASAQYGPGFDGLPANHQQRLIEREAYEEVKRYWKRVRKQSGQFLRYIMVAEAHADGSLHYHALVHERGETLLRWKHLSSQWQAGFSKWKVCDRNPASARYVTKYLTKAISSRCRASQFYGLYLPEERVNEMKVEGITNSKEEFDLSKPQGMPCGRTERPKSDESRGFVTELTGVKNGASLPYRAARRDYHRAARPLSENPSEQQAGRETGYVAVPQAG